MFYLLYSTQSQARKDRGRLRVARTSILIHCIAFNAGFTFCSAAIAASMRPSMAAATFRLRGRPHSVLSMELKTSCRTVPDDHYFEWHLIALRHACTSTPTQGEKSETKARLVPERSSHGQRIWHLVKDPNVVKHSARQSQSPL